MATSSGSVAGSGHDKKAFQYQEGQFICHIYATLRSDDAKQTLDEVVELIKNQQSAGNEQAFERWQPVNCDTQDAHVTLIRGHRAVYYHQIKPLVAAIKSECDLIKPVNLCLDKLRIFHNHERSKQFLCIATREAQSIQLNGLLEMKQKLIKVVDDFAIKLTAEDESESTLAHCSLMSRQVQQVQDEQNNHCDDQLQAIESCILNELDEYPICIDKIDRILMKIGNHVYTFDLVG